VKDEHDWEKFYDSFIDQWIEITTEEERRYRMELEPSNLAPTMYGIGGLIWILVCYFISAEFDLAWYMWIPLALVTPVIGIFAPYVLVTLPLTTLWYEPKLKDYERFRDKVQNAIETSYQDCLTEYGKEIRQASRNRQDKYQRNL